VRFNVLEEYLTIWLTISTAVFNLQTFFCGTLRRGNPLHTAHRRWAAKIWDESRGRALLHLTAYQLGQGSWSEHHLHAPDDFIEVVLAEFRIRLPEIRPRVEIVHHELEIVTADVVIQSGNN